MFNKPSSAEAVFKQSSRLAVALGVTKVVDINVMNRVTLKPDLDVQQTCFEQKLMCSCSFRCDQIIEYECYELGYT